MVVAVCLGTTKFGGVATKSDGGLARPDKVDSIKTRQFSVPIVDRGVIVGYVVVRLLVTVVSDVAKASSVRVEDIVINEAFSALQVLGRDVLAKGKPADLRPVLEPVVS